MNIILRRTLNTILMKSFDQLSHSDAIMHTQMEKLNQHHDAERNPDDSTSRIVGINLEENVKRRDENLTISLLSKTGSSCMAFRYSCTARCNSFRRSRKKTRKTIPRRKARKSKKA